MKGPINTRNSDPEKKKLILCQAVIILISVLLAALNCYMSAKPSVLKNGNTILRDDPGGTDKKYELEVGGLSDSYENISVRVSTREYSEEEACQYFDALMEELAVHIVGNNKDLGGIDTDLVLPKKVDGFDNIKLSWSPADPELISREGKVNNQDLESETDTELSVTLSTGQYSEEYVIPVTVLPAKAQSTEELLDQLSQMIEEADRNQISSSELVLPDSIRGLSLKYSEKKDRTWIQVLAAGIVAAVLIGLKPEQDRRKNVQLRENELLMDYSEVVSKLLVYMGAGLTVRNAWIRIASEYSSSLAAGHSSRRVLYEEMLTTAGELEKGVPENRALNDFARRCSLKCYMKLVSLLEQSTKTGDRRLEAAMQLEIQEAFEQRKNVARRLGEEAGTKLMLPLMLSLVTVFAIVGVPALMSMV